MRLNRNFVSNGSYDQGWLINLGRIDKIIKNLQFF